LTYLVVKDSGLHSDYNILS